MIFLLFLHFSHCETNNNYFPAIHSSTVHMPAVQVRGRGVESSITLNMKPMSFRSGERGYCKSRQAFLYYFNNETSRLMNQGQDFPSVFKPLPVKASQPRPAPPRPQRTCPQTPILITQWLGARCRANGSNAQRSQPFNPQLAAL